MIHMIHNVSSNISRDIFLKFLEDQFLVSYN